MSVSPTALIEIALAGAALALLVAYHWRLWVATRKQPESTAMGRHRQLRAAWVQAMRSGENYLVVVQTLRNWIMAANFLASTAILLSIGLLGVVLTTDKLSSFAHELNLFGSDDERILLLKSLLLVVDFLGAFFNFSLAIRSFIHAGFAAGIKSSSSTASMLEVDLGEIERGALHYTLGMRGFYLAIPLTLWFFGPAWMLAGAVGLVVVLTFVDRTHR